MICNNESLSADHVFIIPLARKISAVCTVKVVPIKLS
uniref:Uncharacterized protein n=1 Tax=Siphoviridae sp. ct3UN6 TaxID=2827769 RepID=A0A8S5S4I9_9CAUD|nr:MAG TPA: hypothetical protein [Siphoviridae sp. ct3UN6]